MRMKRCMFVLEYANLARQPLNKTALRAAGQADLRRIQQLGWMVQRGFMGEALAASSAERGPAPAPPFLLGLIGSPIMSSAAPAMHEAAAMALGLRAHYRLIDVPGADE